MAFIAGIDIGGTRTRCALARKDRPHEIYRKTSVAPPKQGSSVVLEVVEDMIRGSLWEKSRYAQSSLFTLSLLAKLSIVTGARIQLSLTDLSSNVRDDCTRPWIIRCACYSVSGSPTTQLQVLAFLLGRRFGIRAHIPYELWTKPTLEHPIEDDQVHLKETTVTLGHYPTESKLIDKHHASKPLDSNLRI